MSFLLFGFQKTEEEIIKETKRKNNRRITQLEKESAQARKSIELCRGALIAAEKKGDRFEVDKIKNLIRRHYATMQTAEGEISEITNSTTKVDRTQRMIDRVDRSKAEMMLTQRLQTKLQPQKVMQMQYQLEQQKDKFEMTEEILDDIMASSAPEIGEGEEEPSYLTELFSSAKDTAIASVSIFELPSVPLHAPGYSDGTSVYQQASSSSSFVRK